MKPSENWISFWKREPRFEVEMQCSVELVFPCLFESLCLFFAHTEMYLNKQQFRTERIGCEKYRAARCVVLEQRFETRVLRLDVD